jgi:hypothetical protein
MNTRLGGERQAVRPSLVFRNAARPLLRPLRVATNRAGCWKLEVSVLVALYAVYELLRGVRNVDLSLAREHAARIVALERSLHLFSEMSVQRLSERIPVLSDDSRISIRCFTSA